MKKDDLNQTQETNENLEHLTILGNDKPEPITSFDEPKDERVYEPEVKAKKKRKGLFSGIKKLYGFDEEEEDLDFVYSTYSLANEKPSLRANIITFSIIGIFTIFLLWASLAEIDELARGNGKVIPTDKIQTVQSLDGGIISEILVKEGETVKEGAPLMRIDTTRFQATLEESKQEYFSLLALKARLEIESQLDINKKIPKLNFDEKVLNDSSRYDKTEKLLLENRVNELKSSLRVLETQVKQKKQEQLEIQSTIRKLTKSLEFIEQQRKTIKKLVARGVKSKFDFPINI